MTLQRRIPPILALARAWLPPALLILALAALFAFGGDRSYFYRAWFHNENSAKNLALAENLSPRDNFRLFTGMTLADDGSRRYSMYSRFPIGGTALIKLATAPFDGLSAKLAAARTLALLAFGGAAVFACLAVARLTASRRIGLAASLIAFSSYYALYFSDTTSNETMDIFGVMLTFHGMVIFVQDGRFRQLLIKACAALLIGWHVYALLLAFIVFGLAGAIVALMRGRPDSAKGAPARNVREKTAAGWKRHISTFAALIRSRYIILGAATLAFGIIALGANLVNEYDAYGGEKPPAELPTVRSALKRVGASESELRDSLTWRGFAAQQLFRAGGAALPYALPWKRGVPESASEPIPALGVAVGLLAVGGALAGAALASRHRALWTTLALFGFFWAVPLRVNVGYFRHDFEALYYIGVPLALFGTALMGARRLWGERAPVAAALAAVAVFAVSAFQMGNLDRDGERAETLKAEMADFDAIREKTRGETVSISDPVMYAGARRDIIDYYLAGSVFAWGDPLTPLMERVKYVVGDRHYEGGSPLTPENRVAFLYAAEPFHMRREELRRVESTEPAARSDFDVYMEDNALTYLKAPCAENDTRGRFFLSVHPVNAADLPEDRRAIGHDSLNFSFAPQGFTLDGKCAIRRRLPYYPIASISTGQWIPGEGEIWSAEIKLAPSAEAAARCESVCRAAKSSGEPPIESDFDLYQNGDAPTYLNAPCDGDDARGRFPLSVYPADADARREIGHPGLNFDFAPDGIIFANKRMIRPEPPDCPIEKIATGQRIPGGGLRSGEAAAGD